jgi:hypothetical protein
MSNEITPQLPPPPVTQLLQTVITQGREFCARPALVRDASSSWIMLARAAVGKLYGKDTPQVDFWCPKPNMEPAGLSPQARIALRLPNIERLAALIAVDASAGKVFIGHGRSPEWLKLRIFFSQTLSLPCDEFNIESTAGLQTGSRIEGMLNAARIAFLVLTAEDHHSDGTVHARSNVIHEVGLFQAKLGSRRAIVLLEHGCSRFSNLDGLTTINFPPNDIMARSEDIRGVLVREGMLA